MYQKVHVDTNSFSSLIKLLNYKNKNNIINFLKSNSITDVDAYEKFIVMMKQSLTSYKRNTRKLILIKKVNKILDNQLDLIAKLKNTYYINQKNDVEEILDSVITSLQLLISKLFSFNFLNVKNIVWLLSLQNHIGAVPFAPRNNRSTIINPKHVFPTLYTDPSIKMVEVASPTNVSSLNESHVFRSYLGDKSLSEKYHDRRPLLPYFVASQEKIQDELQPIFNKVRYTEDKILIEEMALHAMLSQCDELISEFIEKISSWSINQFYIISDTHNDKPIPILHNFIGNEKLKSIELLLKHGADPAILDPDGHTPLIVAIKQSRRKIIELLITHKADVNQRSSSFVHPLQAAVESEVDNDVKFQFAMLLIKAGADVNVRLEDGSSLLHYCADKNHPELMRLLLDNNANINIRDIYLQTPLHFAQIKQNKKIISLLIEYGANLFVQDLNNNSPIEFLNTSQLKKSLLVEDHYIAAYKKGKHYQEDKKNEKAIATYLGITMHLKPDNQQEIDLLAATHLRLAVLYAPSDNHAIKYHFEQSYRLKSSDQETIIKGYLAALFYVGDMSTAKEVADSGLVLFPKSIELHYSKIEILICDGEYKEALKVIKVTDQLKKEHIPFLRTTILEANPLEVEKALVCLIKMLNKKNTYAYFLKHTDIICLDNSLASLEVNTKKNCSIGPLEGVLEYILVLAKNHYETGNEYQMAGDEKHALDEYNSAIEYAKKLDKTYDSKVMHYFVSKANSHLHRAQDFHIRSQYNLAKNEIEEGLKSLNSLLAASPQSIVNIISGVTKNYIGLMQLFKNVTRDINEIIDRQHYINYLIVIKNAYLKAPIEFHDIYSQTLNYLITNRIYLQNSDSFNMTWQSQNKELLTQLSDLPTFHRHLELVKLEDEYFRQKNMGKNSDKKQNDQLDVSIPDNYFYMFLIFILGPVLVYLVTTVLKSMYRRLGHNKTTLVSKNQDIRKINKTEIPASTRMENINDVFYSNQPTVSVTNFSRRLEFSKQKISEQKRRYYFYYKLKKHIVNRKTTFSQPNYQDPAVKNLLIEADKIIKKIDFIETKYSNLDLTLDAIEISEKQPEKNTRSKKKLSPETMLQITNELDNFEKEIDILEELYKEYMKYLKIIEKKNNVNRGNSKLPDDSKKHNTKSEESCSDTKQSSTLAERKTKNSGGGSARNSHNANDNNNIYTGNNNKHNDTNNNNNNHDVNDIESLFHDYRVLQPKRKRIDDENEMNEFNVVRDEPRVKNTGIQISEAEKEVLNILSKLGKDLKSLLPQRSFNRSYIEQIIRDITNLLLLLYVNFKDALLIDRLTRNYPRFFDDLHLIRNNFLAHPVCIPDESELAKLAVKFINICNIADETATNQNKIVVLNESLKCDIYNQSRQNPKIHFYKKLYNHCMDRLYFLINMAYKNTVNLITEDAHFQNSFLDCIVKLHCTLKHFPDKKMKFDQLLCPIKDRSVSISTLIGRYRNIACHEYDQTVTANLDSNEAQPGALQYYISKIKDPQIFLNLVLTLHSLQEELKLTLFSPSEYENIDINNNITTSSILMNSS